jgi:hypothetical protein
MRFRTKHIADSVVERIQAVANNRAAPVEHRGASTIQLERIGNGDLVVTKTFENGEPEIMTISNSGGAASTQPPEGLVQIGTGDQEQGIVADQGGIVENAALGGDAINAILRG